MIPSNLNINFLTNKVNEMVTNMGSFFNTQNINNSSKTNSNGTINYQMLLIYIIISIVVVYFIFGLLKGPIVIIIGIISGWIAYKSFTN